VGSKGGDRNIVLASRLPPTSTPFGLFLFCMRLLYKTQVSISGGVPIQKGLDSPEQVEGTEQDI
jgi:hypothetical protein